MSQRVRWTEGQYRDWLKRGNAEAPVAILPKPKKGPNQTEAEFLLRLKADWPQLTFLYEQIKLRIGDRCWYTPDFFCPELLTCFEVKGGHIWEDSVVKFKAARTIHPWAIFQMHQKKAGVWRRIH